MTVQMVLLPVFVAVGLTFFLLLWTARARRKAPVRGEARSGDAVADTFDVLFYVLIAIALPLHRADLVIVMLSWIFVVTRFVHAGVFITSNDPDRRSLGWFAGALVVLAMWVYFALKILLLF
jgi:uncharacterized MAPEG superfamily protein